MTAPAAVAGGMRVERVVTSGLFSLDGEDFEVDNNVWLVGDDDRVVVIDAAHAPDLAISEGQGIDLGATHLRVLHTPGHTPGGVCVGAGGRRGLVLRRHPLPAPRHPISRSG